MSLRKKIPLFVVSVLFILSVILFSVHSLHAGVNEVTLLVFFVCLLSAFLLIRRWVLVSITNPLEKIADMVQEIESGNARKIDHHPKDEIGVLSENVNRLVESFQNISTQLKESQEKAQYIAFYDELTGLANRNLIRQHLERAIDHSDSNDTDVAFVLLDIDRFKQINDTLGHLRGDELISLIGKRLAQTVPDGALVGRQGGDEFIIIMERYSPHEVQKHVEKVLEALQAPFYLDGMELFARPSIGIAMYPAHTNKIASLVTYADLAMYSAKEQGGNCIVMYNDFIQGLSEEDIRIEGDLRKAIEAGEIEVFYQPKVDAHSNKIIGAEALIRWKDEVHGYIPPNKFIPIAEETGLIQKLWEYVMEDACKQVVIWNQRLDTPLTVAVNLSAKQFYNPDLLVNKVIKYIEKYEVKPEWLEVEITESILLYNREETTKALKRLKDIGVGISIDDFGTGYSSLSYLKAFPVSKLKIDQSFIRDISEDYSNAEIALAIINLAHSLKLEVVAEGVEENYQKEYLLNHHCHQMQGYLFSKPVPSDEFKKLLPITID